MTEQRIILPIRPCPWIAFRSGKTGLWFVPLDCRSRDRVTGNPEDKGLPCDQYLEGEIFCGHTNKDGKFIKHTLSKRGRQNKAAIERYNKYRLDVYHLAKHNGLQVVPCGMAIYFYFPVPVRWSKTKKILMHGQTKMSKSDCSNLIKGLEDSLVAKDEEIAQISGAGKFWFHPDLVEPYLSEGYIEILIGQPVYNPFKVEFINQYRPIEMEDIESRREKRQEAREKSKEDKKKENLKIKIRKIKTTDELK